MVEYLIQENTLVNMGNSVRNVLNTSDTYTPNEITEIVQSRMLGVPEPIVAGDYPIYGLTTSSKITSTSYTDLDLYIFTANRPGTYRFKWCCMKPAMALDNSGTSASALFLNDVQQFENTSFSDNCQYNSVDVTMKAGDVVRIKGKHSGGMYATYICGVHVCIEWSNANAFFV